MRFEKQKAFVGILLGCIAVVLVRCDGEQPTNPKQRTGSILLDVDVPETGTSAQGAAKVVISRGDLRISGAQLDAEIFRSIPVQGGRLQTLVEDIRVGEVRVELELLESDDAVVWEGNTLVTVVANRETPASLVLERVGDQAPEGNFTVSPENGSVSTQFRFVAEVLDRHDPVDKLEVRWDFDNDGNFETGWNMNKQAEYKFLESGNYRVALEAKDTGGKVNSITRVVNVENTAPIARAGQNITRNVGELVQLDGSASGDPDGDELNYQWTQSSGPSVALDRPNSPDPTFVPQEPGAYSFALVVTDGKLESPADEMVVTVVGQSSTPNANTRPIADAGPDRSGIVGGLVRLDGRGSTDPDGDSLTYEWVQIGGPSVELLGADSPLAEFTPNEANTYMFSLVVGDGKMQSLVDEVNVDVTEPEQPVVNTPPVANAWGEEEVKVGEEVYLDGSGSWDEEDDPLDFIWTQVDGPGVELADAGTEYPYFTPDVPGEYVFELVVSDGKDGSAPAQVRIQVVEPVNTPPVVEAYGPGEVLVGEEVYLDGSSSWDEEDDPLDFIWTQVGGPGVELADAGTEYPYFTPDVPGEYVFELVVSDGKDTSQAPQVIVQVVEPVNTPPYVEASGPEEVMVGDEVYLDGSSSWDEEDDPLEFNWIQVGGPPAELMDAQTAYPFFTPSVPGEYAFELVVGDGKDKSPARQVIVRVLDSGQEPPGLVPRIVFSSNRDGSPALFLVNALGRNPQKLSNGDFDGDVEPEAAPDGVHIAFASYRDGIVDPYPFSGNLAAEIYVMDESGADIRRLTNNVFPDHEPSWSPDGRRIVFVSARNSQDYGYIKTDIFVMNADGSGQVRLSPNDAGVEGEPDWSPDARRIAFTSIRDVDEFGNAHSEIYVMNPDGSNWVNLTNDPSFDNGPDWSPNGRKIAFASNRNGVADVFAMNPDGSGVINLTRGSDSNDWNPAWGPDGLTIAFVSDRTGLQEIFLMNADGRNQRKLADGFAHAAWPTWMRVFEALSKPVGW